MTTQEELFQRHREAEARVAEHQTLIGFHQKEMTNIEDTLGQLVSSGSNQGSVEVIERIRESGNHLGAMQVLAKQNGNQLDLEHAARMIRMAGMSQSSTVRLVSSLRCRANDSPQWDASDRDTVRFMPGVEPAGENQHDSNQNVGNQDVGNDPGNNEAGNDLFGSQDVGNQDAGDDAGDDAFQEARQEAGEPGPTAAGSGAWTG